MLRRVPSIGPHYVELVSFRQHSDIMSCNLIDQLSEPPMTANPFRPQPLPELSVVVPCFNEAHLIESLINEWIFELRAQGVSFELIAVNDGSLDGTGRVLDKLRKEHRELRVIHQLNTGHCRAVLRGYQAARGKYTLQVDGNGRYEPGDFLPLWEKRHEAALILGSRTHRIDGILRRALGGMTRLLVRHVGGAPIEDPGCGLRLFSTQLAAPLLKAIPVEGIHCNTGLSLAMHRQFPEQILQIKTPFRKRPYGNSHTPLFSAWLGLFSLGFDLIALRRAMKRATKPLIQQPAS